ncbi:hypothetical protein D9Q98_008228 [Chlorella vulgaris]|uniref:J domain-containing protein n=1 Tax=Chlorella vulgaris TaxID=3077 RepID=A0A9D4TG89_CHLVU|nr:hypothetical protein D9Q98_008228 [Chlorella vulgaris]
MRAQGARLLFLAHQTTAEGVQSIQARSWIAASSDRAAWLWPIGCRHSSTASVAAPPALYPAAVQHAIARGSSARGISSSIPAQHNAEPAHNDAAAAAAAEACDGQQQERTCWQCGHSLTTHDLFFCPECDSVQPAGIDVQHFPILGMDQPQFELDLRDLERRYKALQIRLHPDKFATASSLEQEYAQQQAAAINQAYDVLKRPLRRAHYILSQRGFGACEGMTITDPELLMYVMEAREEVEGTPANDTARLQALLDTNQSLEQRCIQELSAAFAAGDLQHAAELTTQLRYICRIREAIVEKM